MYTEVVKVALLKRLTRLQHLMEADGLLALILFENDFVAYKLSLTQHFNIVLITPGDVYAIADIALYHEARRESPWNVVLIENFTLDELAKKILSMLSKDRSKIKLGVNKSWGRNKLSFLYKGPVWMGYDGCIAHTFIVGQSQYWGTLSRKSATPSPSAWRKHNQGPLLASSMKFLEESSEDIVYQIIHIYLAIR